MPVVIKRVYESPSPTDGTRVLVDRLWPRGLTKAAAAVDDWLRELAPSNELRRWYHARPEQWDSFRKKYLQELSRPEAQDALSRLSELARQKNQLTLLFASKNEDRNNATVLKELLSGVRKPPAGTTMSTAPARRARRAAPTRKSRR
jgi:uncharacterized protein YeaO (DUF488 family)